MLPYQRVERKHNWIYDEEMPKGWRLGHTEFVRTPDAPGGVTHHVFIFDPKVSYEDRRPNGEDARWIVGTLSCMERKVVEYPWETVDPEEYVEETGLFSEYRL